MSMMGLSCSLTMTQPGIKAVKISQEQNDYFSTCPYVSMDASVHGSVHGSLHASVHASMHAYWHTHTNC